MLKRCSWVTEDPLYLHYHDEEWGEPLRDDRKLFELLCLEGAQAGLSWLTILRKRARYREAFDGFDPERMARYGDAQIAELLEDPGIVRNRLKIRAFIANAQAYLRLRDERGGFADYLWDYVDGVPIRNRWIDSSQVPARTPLSDKLSKDLKRRGFSFVGSTICYAFLQSSGMVNDHTLDCFKSEDLRNPEVLHKMKTQ